MSERILILGGTKEATELATQLVGDGQSVITSLAGRTKEPKPVAGDVRIGGFGGVEAMTRWMADHQISKVIDCTHPFAEQISANAVKACSLAGVPLDVHKRAPWTKHADDIWHEVGSLSEARDAIPKNAKVLLALGSQHLAGFETRDDIHFVVRMVDQPQEPLSFKQSTLVLGRPSLDASHEMEILEKHRITHIVCRNSGGKGAYAKIIAARRLNIPVMIVAMTS